VIIFANIAFILIASELAGFNEKNFYVALLLISYNVICIPLLKGGGVLTKAISINLITFLMGIAFFSLLDLRWQTEPFEEQDSQIFREIVEQFTVNDPFQTLTPNGGAYILTLWFLVKVIGMPYVAAGLFYNLVAQTLIIFTIGRVMGNGKLARLSLISYIVAPQKILFGFLLLKDQGISAFITVLILLGASHRMRSLNAVSFVALWLDRFYFALYFLITKAFDNKVLGFSCALLAVILVAQLDLHVYFFSILQDGMVSENSIVGVYRYFGLGHIQLLVTPLPLSVTIQSDVDRLYIFHLPFTFFGICGFLILLTKHKFTFSTSAIAIFVIFFLIQGFVAPGYSRIRDAFVPLFAIGWAYIFCRIKI
jgi:hypothetical protein